MSVDINRKGIFRIVPIQNLEYNLQNGLFCKNAGRTDDGFITIGSKEIISERDRRIVKCYPDTVVNDYVPFYFSKRTPMLYNIITGHGVPKFSQEDIVYLCFKLTEMAVDDFQWCFTDGNAAKKITKYATSLDLINELDWHSILTTDFRDENADGDEDRIRKKHSEFLIKGHVPSSYIKYIVVLNENKQKEVEAILEKLGLDIEVKINPDKKYYFL